MAELWKHADYTAAEVRAVQGLHQLAMAADHPPPAGEPEPQFTPYEAKLLLKYLERVCQYHDVPTMVALASGDTTGMVAPFVDGRRSVWKQVSIVMRLTGEFISELARKERAAKQAKET